VLSRDPRETVTALKQQRGKAIWLFGGGSLFRSLLDLGLVDEVQVGVVPVLVGDGLPLVEHPAKLAKLRLTGHRVYQKTGTVLLDYEVLRASPDPLATGRTARRRRR
jgi:dihydrofolate reductase